MGDPRPPENRTDAGLRSLDHYKNRLPRWRYSLRQFFIPLLRQETPSLALLQETFRTPALDTYFAFTANLGTHTFFMIVLPILFWCGERLSHVLAAGVFLSGFLKDMMCLPRPLSPPLQRISRSASVALEYGFPSTHSTNAVSVAVYILFSLSTSGADISPPIRIFLQGLACFYATSIVVGRVYCGMHGFSDVVAGSLLGAGISLLQCAYGPTFDDWVFNGPFKNIVILTLTVMVLVRIHPEPADDCPCFDDSVAFSGVFVGLQIGGRHFSRTVYAWNDHAPSAVPFSLEELGWLKAALRILLGVFVIFAWRGIMKPMLLKGLPPLFRVIEKLGLSLPRKFFLNASQYETVPPLRKDDNVIPSASEIPRMITSLRHPRKRAVSIGPQSEADAYETLAYRERKRKESVSSIDGPSPSNPVGPPSNKTDLMSPPSRTTSVAVSPSPLDTPASSPYDGGALPADAKSAPQAQGISTQSQLSGASVRLEEEREDREMFQKLQKPRVRYDVEVVTKLIIYTGIGLLASEVDPLLFHLCGLAPR